MQADGGGIQMNWRGEVPMRCRAGHDLMQEASVWISPSTGKRRCRACYEAKYHRANARRPRSGGKPGPVPRGLTERFWEKVDRSGDGCWQWIARSRAHFGYGSFNIGGRGGRQEKAHRVAWMLTFGPIPEGMQVLHHCDNPPCCRPGHLFLGTHADNVADMDAKGRRITPDRRGERGRARLKVAQVATIRKRLAAGELQRVIARDFGVAVSTIGEIARGATWNL